MLFRSIRKNEEPTFKWNNKSNTPIVPKGEKAYCLPAGVVQMMKDYCAGDSDVLDAIQGLLENRAANKKPVKTERAMQGILRDLDKHSNGNRDLKLILLERSTTHNWLTVFKPRPEDLPTDTPASHTVVEEEQVRYI